MPRELPDSIPGAAGGAPADSRSAAEIVAELRSEAARAAILCDIDGTLAPIVADPTTAAVPDETRRVLAGLAGRYRLVGCVSGRPARLARRMVGLEELAYAGNHGLELLLPGDPEPRVEAGLDRAARRVASLIGGLDRRALEEAGVRLEDKGPIQALHWRGAGDEQRAVALAEQVAERARTAGLVPHFGRKVLEIRPVAEIDKAVAVSRLVAGSGAELALYGGDDRTDLDGFRALRELAGSGALRLAVSVGVASEEGPPEIAEQADVVVAGTEGYLALLREL